MAVNKIEETGTAKGNKTGDADYTGYFDVVESEFTADNLKQFFDTNSAYNSYDISSKLFNYPYHFLTSVDMPVNTKVNLGRKFMENISANARVLYITPGAPSYLPKESKATKKAMTSFLQGKNSTTGDNWALDQIRSEGLKGMYFDFRNDYPTYMRYVNGICRALAIYLGIGDEKGPDGKTTLKHYCWENNRYTTNQGNKKVNSVFTDEVEITSSDYVNNTNRIDYNDDSILNKIRETLFSDWQYTQYYLDTNSSFSESFSNSTMESSIKSGLSDASKAMKEVAFLANVGGISTSSFNTTIDSALDKLQETFAKNDGIFSRIIDGATTVISGNQMIFPDMWESSTNSKSYSLSFYLAAPYGDTLTVYLNTWVPLIHLMCYTLPRQTKNSPNAMTSPFLIRAFCRGMFSCKMGIVESMTIDKTESVNVDGLPSRIKVNMYIRDLYNYLAISPSNRPIEFFSNDALMDFLAVTAGINLAEPSMIKTIDLLTTLLTNKVSNIPHNIYTQMINGIRNVTGNLFNLY